MSRQALVSQSTTVAEIELHSSVEILDDPDVEHIASSADEWEPDTMAAATLHGPRPADTQHFNIFSVGSSVMGDAAQLAMDHGAGDRGDRAAAPGVAAGREALGPEAARDPPQPHGAVTAPQQAMEVEAAAPQPPESQQAEMPFAPPAPS